MPSINRIVPGSLFPVPLSTRLIVASLALMVVAPLAAAQELSPAVESRIARVVHGLSTRVVVKGAPDGWHVYPQSAAALWTTPTDLAKVVVDIQQAYSGKPGKVLSSAMTSTMLSRGLGEYGLGLYVEKLGGGTSFSHSGGTDGFRSQLYGYTHTGQGIVVMTNSDNGAALIDEILVSVAAEYGWPEFQITEKVALDSDPAANATFAGHYILAGKPAQIIAEGDRLYLQSELFAKQPMQLFAESKTRFFMTA